MKRRSLSPFAITQILMAAAVAVAVWLAYWPWRWSQVRDEVRKQYPGTTWIEGGTLQLWMANPTVSPPLLLDVRTAPEYDASHLPNAIRVVRGASLAANKLPGAEARQIVIYDAVGYEAASFASDLKRQNFKDVQVLDGGIFLWANEGRPLLGPSGPATRVSAGQSEHAALLSRSRRLP